MNTYRIWFTPDRYEEVKADYVTSGSTYEFYVKTDEGTELVAVFMYECVLGFQKVENKDA